MQTDINSKYKTILEWATAYRKFGWQVVPLYGFSKNPQGTKVNEGGVWVASWKKLQQRKATDEEFNRWFVEDKPTGLGIITGEISGVTVVDVDSYKANGMKFNMMSPMRARSARGGTHHYFKFSPEIKTTGLKDGVFIEIKSEGGFIVLPPSQVYTDDTGTKTGKYLWEHTCFPEKMPMLSQPDVAPFAKAETTYTDMHNLIEADLGSQHNNLRTIANKLYHRFPKAEWDIADRLIWDEAKRFKPPHSDERIRKMIHDCRVFMDKARQEGVEVREIEEPRSMAEVSEERRFERELEKKAPGTGYKDLDELVKGFVPGHLYTFTAETNAGKTALACNFAYRVSTLHKQKVLYYALEPENTIVDYLASIRTGKRYDELTDEDLMYDDPNIKIYGKQQISTTADLIQSLGSQKDHYGLVIIDHVGYFNRSKEKENYFQGQADVIKDIVGAAKQHKMAIMIIAHLRKRDTRSRSRMPSEDDIAGSAAFKQDSTEVFIMTRDMRYKDDEKKDGGFSWLPTGKIFVAKTKSGMNGVVDLIFSERSALILTPEEQSLGMFSGKGMEFNENF